MRDFEEKVWEFSIAQVTSLNTAPITLLPATAGILWVPQEAVFIRTGARYATHPGNLQIRAMTASPFAWLLANTASGILIGTGSGGRHAWHTGLWQGQTGASDATGDPGSKAVDLFALSGNPTVDGTNPGSRIILVMHYVAWPTHEANLPILWRNGRTPNHGTM